MTLKNKTQVAVVGSGLTGSWVAKTLSEAGLKVILIEAGPPVTPIEAVLGTPLDNGAKVSHRQSVQSRHPSYRTHNPHLFVDDIDNPYDSTKVPEFSWIRGRQLGGRSHLWRGVALRMSDFEFAGGRNRDELPAWPLSLRDLAPYYAKVEQFMGVEGTRCGLDECPDGLFLDPATLTTAEERFSRKVESVWPERHVIHCRGITSNRRHQNDSDPRWAPRNALHACLFNALSTGNLSISTDCVVARLLSNDAGDVKGLTCIDRITGRATESYASVVVLCASSFETVRILLNSRGPRHRAGVGNSSGQLGRFIMDHLVVQMSGPIRSRRTTDIACGGANGILIPRFQNLKDSDQKFSGGYGIWGEMERTVADSTGLSTWSLHAMLEVLPKADNCLYINERKCDSWGVPSAVIEFEYGANEVLMRDHAQLTMIEMIHAAGLTFTSSGTSNPGAYAHELGGARMGNDSATSVVNNANQCWDAPNVFLLDGSCFVTSGWQNPTLTMMALAVRGAEKIVSDFRCGLY